jgi:hypothetical protein
MRTLDHVQTEHIDIAGKTEEFTARQVAVTSPNPKAAVLNTVVDVFFKIGERRTERSFSLPVPGTAGRVATFVVFAPRTLLGKAHADDFRIEMFLDESGEDTPRIILPASLEGVAEIRRLAVKP